jgi:hypothetical protein
MGILPVFKRVTAGTERLDRFAFVEKDTGLALPNGELGSPFYFAGSFFRQAVDQFAAAFVKPLQIFQKYPVVAYH